ncbi:1-aminocyclopropane-1-carboxylate synthase-like protein 1, partial [Phycomyces nitens]
MISQRALQSLALESPLRRCISLTKLNFYDASENPSAPINLGVAHNGLMQGEVLEKLSSSLAITHKDLNYNCAYGSMVLRDRVASLVTRNFKTINPVYADNIVAFTGAGAAAYYLSIALADPGESIMIIAPYYGMFDGDVCGGTGISLFPVYLSSLEDNIVHASILEEAFERAKKENVKIKALLVTNPDNPIGRCYSREGLETFARFASKHSIHLILDEVYALSTFSHLDPSLASQNTISAKEAKGDPFTSILSLENLPDLIDPALVHVIYGMSKDFGLNGLRIGFIIDQCNEALRSALHASAVMSYISSITDRTISNFLSDPVWIDHFIATNRRRLADAYKRVSGYLKDHGVRHLPVQAGHFIFVDLRPFLIQRNKGKPPTLKDEQDLWQILLDNGVYVAPGEGFRTKEHGFFRITFPLTPNLLDLGLDRLYKIIIRFGENRVIKEDKTL